MKFTDYEDAQTGYYIPQRILVYGLSKSGKSTLAAELAEHGFNLIWHSIDGGHSVISKLSREARERIDLIWTRDTRESPFGFDTNRKLMKGGKVSICHQHGIVSCTPCTKAAAAFSDYCLSENNSRTIFVTDHLTQVTQSCMNVITRGKADDYRPERDDWGSLYFHLGALLSTYQAAPFHVIALAQIEEAEQDDKTKKIGPSIGSRKFTVNVGQYFDHVVYTRIRNKSHEAGSSTTFEASVISGSRTDVAIETQSKLSLLPFFSGVASKAAASSPEKQQEVKQVEQTLQQAKSVATAATQSAPATATAALLAKLKAGK